MERLALALRTVFERALRLRVKRCEGKGRMNRPKKKMQDGQVVARLLELKTKTHRALAGDSNDAEHDALYDVEEALGGLTPDVRRMEDALNLCVEFLQTGEIQPAGERHPYSLWFAAVSSGQLALGQQLRKGEDGKLRWRRIQKLSTSGKPRSGDRMWPMA
jgi:hypothetical protein